MKDHVLRLVRWYDLAGEYLSNYRIDKAFLRGSFPVYGIQGSVYQNGRNAKFLEQSGTVGGEASEGILLFPHQDMRFNVRLNRGLLVFEHDTDKLCGCSSSLQSSIIFYQ